MKQKGCLLSGGSGTFKFAISNNSQVCRMSRSRDTSHVERGGRWYQRLPGLTSKSSCLR